MTPSPESRLLDLIRKKRGPTAKERWMSTLKRSPRWVNKIKGDSVVPWRWANICLAIFLGATLTYGGFVFVGRKPSLPLEGTRSSFASSDHRSSGSTPSPADLARRDLFKDMAPPPPPPPMVVNVPAGPPPPPKIPLSERASRFRLVGILSGDKPQAIIEDVQTQRTIYASQGQRIEGILVESVTSGKVVLSDGDERFDITL